MSDFIPLIRPGVKLGIVDDNFVIAVLLENLTDEDVALSRMNGELFTVKLKEQYEGMMWRPSGAVTQAMSKWKLEANESVCYHYKVPNEEDAFQIAKNRYEKTNTLDDDITEEEFVIGPGYEIKERLDEIDSEDKYVVREEGVNPFEDRIVWVDVSFPSNNINLNISRQYDLRGEHRRKELVDNLPEEDKDGLSMPTYSTIRY